MMMTNQFVTSTIVPSTSETTCYLDVVVRDSVRDSFKSSGLVYEDQTTLTLVYLFNWDDGARNKISNNGNASGMGNVNSSNANAVIALDHFAAGGPKASDLSTINRKSIQSSNDGGSSSCLMANSALCSNPSASFDDLANGLSHPSYSSNVSSTNGDILFSASSTFAAFKQWLKLATNSKTFLIYASIIIFSNLISMSNSLLVVDLFHLFASFINHSFVSYYDILADQIKRPKKNQQ
ncbi:hypothetical protein BLA29_008154 [Euroglyphus maynei]|uniref:Uncharacterized protein n=1 Tax=Euroglyphus maynei TaxID=6958 RepID=A0A1Y3B0B8_EURMA|nr:hypothetical protein BLA29_008154 [Euroglyphus maynei]